MHAWKLPQRCEHCGAPDNRDRDHARGCPALAPVPRERLIAIARKCEAEWDRKRARAERRAAALGATA